MIYFKLRIGGRRGLRQPTRPTTFEALAAWVDAMDRIVVHLAGATGRVAAWQRWYGQPVFRFAGSLAMARAAIHLLDPTLRVIRCSRPGDLDKTVGTSRTPQKGITP